ncbi:EAL and GGDEF domain-containing protein [Sphingobium chlorophenolicum]|uniref:Diguanylate cyclase/phosphodiesterase with PAS/PAC sensor(S) n=1 Tax=Sphingobium chlorophenolicum TaxID=46429 RepID=A0A081RFQ5_SPHCR|nr:EAL domain-containing protein [Sphingobium chlorophenolicum]KEQ54028.1 Diguanylate cyclase/phosphodiesterase with PAS/PAC sensor(S) [Sphingobium chlorophenolicum]
MDRFADRRFQELGTELARDGLDWDSFHYRNELLFSPVFQRVSPPLIRWIADSRGRILSREIASDLFARYFSSDMTGNGWRAMLDRRDRKALAEAARQSSGSTPVPVRMRTLLGETRSGIVRMTRVQEPDEQPLWYGTVEDVDERYDRDRRALADALAESRQHYRWSVELSPQVPWTAAPDGEVEEIGPRWRDLTGIDPEEAKGSGWIDSLHPDDVERTTSIWMEKVRSGDPVDVDYRLRLVDGSYRWMRSRASARRDAKGRIVRWYGTLEDIHAQKLAQRELADSEERFRLAVQSARLGIWDFDAVAGTRTWSQEFRSMLGLSDTEPATSELALKLVHPEDRPRLAVMLDAVASERMPPHFEATLRIYRADTGALRWIKSVGWRSFSDSGRPLRVIVTFQDVTEERDSEDRIRWAATHDPMTRMPNRALWQATLEEMTEQARRRGDSFGLILVDIDDLKRTNDMLGHDAGDALLCGFAQRFAACAPADAMVGRLGGDEFGMIAPSLTSGAALTAWSAELLGGVRTPYVHNGRSLDCGISIGGAVFGEHGDNAAELLKAADLALYASKSSGRGRLTLFQSQLRAEAQQRSSMIHMARQAIADDLVVPHYQPKADMKTGRILGYEALLRWEHPRTGVHAPDTIAAAFDNAEIAVELTEIMLAKVVRDVDRWLRSGYDPGRVAINASAADFMQHDFADHVLAHLARYAVPPQRFEIEVTETVFLGRGAEQVERALHRLSAAGVRIALDDFGTGYASLSHLKQYPVDVLKIDRSFISNIERDAGDAVIVDAIVNLGNSLGMEVVAEGVETAGQADLLIARGCIIGQGYLMGRPRPWAAVRSQAA